MADDPRQSPNSSRIQSMLNDLAQQRGSAATPGSPPPPQGGTAPANLPTGSPQGSSPSRTQPPTPPRQQPSTTPAPGRGSTPPAPSIPPLPATPPAPTEPAPPAHATPNPPPRPPAPTAQRPQAPKPQNAAPEGIKPKESVEAQPSRGTEETPTSTEVRTMTSDVQRLRVGQAPTPSAQAGPVQSSPDTPAPPTPPPSTRRPSVGITAPPEGRPQRRTTIPYAIGTFALLAILGLGAYSLFSGDETPSPTPSPTVSATPSPTSTPSSAKDVSFYFGQLSGTIRMTITEPTRQDIRNALAPHLPGTAGQARNVEVQGLALFPSVLTALSSEELGIESAVLVFAQGELFDANGIPLSDITPQPRLVFISEVTNATAVRNALTTWESALTGSDEILFDIEATQASVPLFSDGEHRGVTIRYQNYPYADKSIDWAIVPASNQKNYLVIAGSRESIFFTIDQLLK